MIEFWRMQVRRLSVMAVVVAACFLNAQTCPPKGWCEIYSTPLLPNNGYNNVIFSPDTSVFYLYAGNRNLPSTSGNGPEATTFWSYSVQGDPATINPWMQVSDCNDNATTEERQQILLLHQSIGITDSSAIFAIGLNGTMALTSKDTIPQSGTFWVADEAMDYNGCDALTPSFVPGSCAPGTMTFRLNKLIRGVRQGAGWLPAYPHTGGSGGPTNHGEVANLTCPSPTLTRAPTSDHPPSRHSVADVTYDTKRGAIWVAWGFQENWTLLDTWYLCVFPTSFCSIQKINAGWQRLALFSTGGQEPIGYRENATIYDADTDSLFSFGGIYNGNSTSDQFIFCLSTPTTAYGCNGTVFKWIKVTPHGGNPGKRDAIRMAWDSVNHRILVMGGLTFGTNYTNTVAQYDSRAGDWCISDPILYGTNAPSCNLPLISGNVPPVNLTNRWPAWTFDSKRGKATYLNFSHVYQYDAAANSWTVTSAPPGPTAPPQNQQPHQSWAYDASHDVFVWVRGGENGQLWQLPSPTISNPEPPRSK